MFNLCVGFCLQVVTADRHAAESAMQARVVASHAAQQSAEVARKGNYMDSRVTGHAYNALFARNLRSVEDESVYKYVSMLCLPDPLPAPVAVRKALCNHALNCCFSGFYFPRVAQFV